jgi:hypothetical protein
MEKLQIKNIVKIIGTYLPNGRWISEAGVYDDISHNDHDNYYKFVVYGDKYKDREFDGEQVVVLRRISGNQYSPYEAETMGKYELFTMGLQNCTSHYLQKSEIGNLDILIEFIDKVLNKTKEFYKNNK